MKTSSSHAVAAAAAAALSVGHQSSTVQQQRAASAFLGSVVGDAAAQTSHWNYDREKFHLDLRGAGRYDEPEFFASNKFHSLPPGSQSCYGDQMMEVARHLDEWKSDHGSANGGPTSPDGLVALIDRFESAFGPSSPYGPWPLPDGYKPPMPLDGPWRHGSLKGFLANLGSGQRDFPECGSDDSQADAIARTVPVVCAYAGHSGMLESVEKVVRVTQNTNVAVAYSRLAARILEAFIIENSDLDNINVREVIRLSLQAEMVNIAASTKEEGKDIEEEMEARRGACKMISLALEVLDGDPTSFEEAVSDLGKHPLMKPRLAAFPTALVA